VHFFPGYPHYGHHAGFDWTALAAIAAIALAIVTGWLAFSTRKLARASTADQRAQWRPILTVDPEGHVDYDDATGELSFELRNVGRGPALASVRTYGAELSRSGRRHRGSVQLRSHRASPFDYTHASPTPARTFAGAQ
jgi:hypothetical protein